MNDRSKEYVLKMPRKRVRLTEDMLMSAVRTYIHQVFHEAQDVRVSIGPKHITATFNHCKHEFETRDGYRPSVWYHKCKHCGYSWEQDDS